MKLDLRITLNNRLATAAAAMVQRIMMRSMPRVLRPPSPLRKGSNPVVAMLGDENAVVYLVAASKGVLRADGSEDGQPKFIASPTNIPASWFPLYLFMKFEGKILRNSFD